MLPDAADRNINEKSALFFKTLVFDRFFGSYGSKCALLYNNIGHFLYFLESYLVPHCITGSGAKEIFFLAGKRKCSTKNSHAFSE